MIEAKGFADHVSKMDCTPKTCNEFVGGVITYCVAGCLLLNGVHALFGSPVKSLFFLCHSLTLLVYVLQICFGEWYGNDHYMLTYSIITANFIFLIASVYVTVIQIIEAKDEITAELGFFIFLMVANNIFSCFGFYVTTRRLLSSKDTNIQTEE